MNRFGIYGLTAPDLRIGNTVAPEEMELEEAGPTEEPTVEDRDNVHAYVVNTFRKLWDYERQRFQPWLDRIKAAWELYHMSYVRERDPNQADLKFPTTMIFVERTAALLMRMIDQSSHWYKMEAFFPQEQVVYNLCRRFISQIISHPDNNFWSVLEEGFKSGIISGQIHLQVLPTQNGTPINEPELSPDMFALFGGKASEVADLDKRPKMMSDLLPKISLAVVPADTVLLDSSGNGRYVMWTMDVPAGTVFAEAEERGYDREALKRAVHKPGAEYMQGPNSVEDTRDGFGPDSSLPKAHIRLHFLEGDMPDIETGAILFKRKLAVIANGCELILLRDIPFWDNKFSILSAPFIKPPHAVYGKGLVSENVDGFHSKEEVLNLLLDYLKRVLNPPYQVNSEAMEDDTLRHAHSQIFPNRIYRVRHNSDGPVIIPISPGEVPQSTWQVVQATESMHQDTTGTGGQLGGVVRTRGRITANEFQSRQAEAGAMWWNVFKNLERECMAKVLRTIFLRVLQFFPDELWRSYVEASITALLDPVVGNPQKTMEWKQELQKIANYKAAERYEKLGGYFSFTVKVFSAMAERQAEIEKGSFMLRTIGPIPGAIQTMRLPRVIQKLVEAFGWDPEEVMLPEAVQGPKADLPPVYPQAGAGQGESDDDMIDLSMGGMSALNSMTAQMSPQTSGLFPGGPVQPTANPPSPPGM